MFLVDRGNLADQTYKEFTQYTSPYNNYKFTEEFIVQRLQSNTIDTTARVCICTIQRMYSMLSNHELPETDDEASIAGLEALFKQQPPIEYNPNIPIETFDIIITDECHRSIYNCSGLMNPDTNLGGNIAAVNEVFNEKTASIFRDRI